MVEGNMCDMCHASIKYKPVVTGGDNPRMYHPECYRCKMCKLQLPERHILEVADNSLWCVKCHSLHNPHCPKCGMPVVGEACPAVDGLYHEDCFRCTDCGTKLRGEYFGNSHENFRCEPCANLPQCCQCKASIKGDANGTKYIICRGDNYHEACFTCAKCDNVMGDDETKPMLSKDGDHLLCMPCHRGESPLCSACNDPCDESYVLFGEGQDELCFHKWCVICHACEEVIPDGKEVWRRPEGLRCNECHHKMAPPCRKCNTGVVGRLLLVEDDTYHPDCFRCLQCNKPGEEGIYYKEKEEYICDDCHSGYDSNKGVAVGIVVGDDSIGVGKITADGDEAEANVVVVGVDSD